MNYTGNLRSLIKGHLLSDLIYPVFCSCFISPGLTSKGAKAPHGDKSINPRKLFSDAEIATLDNVYVTSKGRPSKAVIETTAKALKLDERQVS